MDHPDPTPFDEIPAGTGLVNAYFYKHGVSFRCARCGIWLEDHSLFLRHPMGTRGILWWKKAISCPWAGRPYKHPFNAIVVHEIEAPQ